MGKQINFLFIFFIAFFLISLTSAYSFQTQSSLGTFKQGECIELRQLCADCSYVNFTRVSFPDSSRALTNVQAQKDGIQFNYTFCNTSELGIYIVEGVGDLNGTDNVFIYNFQITPTGKELTVAHSIMYGIILIILLVLFLGSFIWFNQIQWGHYTNEEGTIVQVNYDRSKKVALFFLSYLLMVFILFIARNMTNAFMILDDSSVLFNVFFKILLVSLMPILIASVIIIIILTISDSKLQEAIFRGFEVKR